MGLFFAIVGYVVSFIIIFFVIAIADVNGWYVVYIPFLALIGAVVSPMIWYAYKD